MFSLDAEIGQHIVNILNNKRNIQFLDLNTSSVTSQTIEDIARALENNNSLIEISLPDDPLNVGFEATNLKALKKSIQKNNNILAINISIDDESEIIEELEELKKEIETKVQFNNDAADELATILAEEKPLNLLNFQELLKRRAAVKYKLETEHNKSPEDAKKLIEGALKKARENTFAILGVSKEFNNESPFASLDKHVLKNIFKYDILETNSNITLSEMNRDSILKEFFELIEENNIPNLKLVLSFMDHDNFDQYKEIVGLYTKNQEIIDIIDQNLEKVKAERKYLDFVPSQNNEDPNKSILGKRQREDSKEVHNKKGRGI